MPLPSSGVFAYRRQGQHVRAGCVRVVPVGLGLQLAVDDGQKAVDLVTSGGFAAVLMDCHMPVLDGFAATRKLRAQGYRLPIIALTALASAADREACLRAGMDDYLSKPLDAAKLAHVVDRWLPANASASPSTDSVAAPLPVTGQSIVDRTSEA